MAVIPASMPRAQPQDSVSRLVTAMVGITYTGVADLQVAFETQKATFVDEPADVLFPADAPIFAASTSL